MATFEVSDEKLEETELALLIGKITMLWNQLHDTTRYCFPIVLGENPKLVSAVLDPIKSDDVQRNVVLSVIHFALPGDQHADLRDEASRLFNLIGRLAGQRNGFVHSSWIRTDGGRAEVSSVLKKPHGAIDRSEPLKQGMELLRQIESALSQMFILWGKLQSAIGPRSHHPQYNPS